MILSLLNDIFVLSFLDCFDLISTLVFLFQFPFHFISFKRLITSM